MLQYRPPKSHIWGHSLKSLAPEAIRSRFAAFMTATVAESRFVAGRLLVGQAKPVAESKPENLLARFERLLELPPQDGSFELTEPQFDKCLDEIIRDPELLKDPDTLVLLTEFLQVGAWKIDGREVKTSSLLTLGLGKHSYLTTLLSFNDRAEFDLVRQSFLDVGLCDLSEKHLREAKQRASY